MLERVVIASVDWVLIIGRLILGIISLEHDAHISRAGVRDRDLIRPDEI
jgi:hypothetical protein